MNKIISKASFVALLLSSTGCSTPGSSRSTSTVATKAPLRVERYVGSEAGFLVTSNLIIGDHDAILVDAQFTRSDAANVVKMIQASGRQLKTVFVTHGHPDHYFGIDTLKQAFPNARYVASNDTVQDIQATGQGKLDYWKKMYGAELPNAVPTVSTVSSADLILDGEQLVLKSIAPGESEHATMLVVPSLKAAFVGDMAYDEVHLWLAEAASSTESWKSNLRSLEADETVSSIYVGHQKTSRDNTKAILNINAQYIDDAVRIFKSAASPKEGAAAIKAKYPTYGLPVIADIAATAF